MRRPLAVPAASAKLAGRGRGQAFDARGHLFELADKPRTRAAYREHVVPLGG